jgi:hypothetical protein
MHQNKADCHTPVSQQKQTSPSPNMHATIASLAFLAITVDTTKNLFQFFHTHGALVQSSVKDIGYYVKSILENNLE